LFAVPAGRLVDEKPMTLSPEAAQMSGVAALAPSVTPGGKCAASMLPKANALLGSKMTTGVIPPASEAGSVKLPDIAGGVRTPEIAHVALGQVPVTVVVYVAGLTTTLELAAGWIAGAVPTQMLPAGIVADVRSGLLPLTPPALL